MLYQALVTQEIFVNMINLFIVAFHLFKGSGKKKTHNTRFILYIKGHTDFTGALHPATGNMEVK